MVKRQVCDASVGPGIHSDLERGPHVSRRAVVGIVGLALSPHLNLRSLPETQQSEDQDGGSDEKLHNSFDC